MDKQVLIKKAEQKQIYQENLKYFNSNKFPKKDDYLDKIKMKFLKYFGKAKMYDEQAFWLFKFNKFYRVKISKKGG